MDELGLSKGRALAVTAVSASGPRRRPRPGVRVPTVQDVRTPAWGKALLRTLARWRYTSGRYDNPWELAIAHRFIRLREPQTESV